jgi:hypothetical protein
VSQGVVRVAQPYPIEPQCRVEYNLVGMRSYHRVWEVRLRSSLRAALNCNPLGWAAVRAEYRSRQFLELTPCMQILAQTAV